MATSPSTGTTPTPSVTGPVLETFPLGNQWPTVDPFLFVAHHRDRYPAGDDRMAPAAPLTGRDLGSDFADVDGWNMYHGRTVPGFPQHPHRGFETITYVRTGVIDHADSIGATARFGRGDTQWMTAGSGVVHSEMFPLLDPDGGNPLELFQIWLNLPRASKMVDPYFTMLWRERTPRWQRRDDDGTVEVTVIAGALDPGDGTVLEPLAPPPDSWAAHPDADVAVWHLHLTGSAPLVLPPARVEGAVRVLYVFDGDGLVVAGPSASSRVPSATGAAVVADRPVTLTADGGAVSVLVLQGRPIAEPLAQYGPFVLNDRAGIVQAIEDYQRTGFGGWPWPSDDPVHQRDRGRFARHADGRVEEMAGPAADPSPAP